MSCKLFELLLSPDERLDETRNSGLPLGSVNLTSRLREPFGESATDIEKCQKNLKETCSGSPAAPSDLNDIASVGRFASEGEERGLTWMSEETEDDKEKSKLHEEGEEVEADGGDAIPVKKEKSTKAKKKKKKGGKKSKKKAGKKEKAEAKDEEGVEEEEEEEEGEAVEDAEEEEEEGDEDAEEEEEEGRAASTSSAKKDIEDTGNAGEGDDEKEDGGKGKDEQDKDAEKEEEQGEEEADEEEQDEEAEDAHDEEPVKKSSKAEKPINKPKITYTRAELLRISKLKTCQICPPKILDDCVRRDLHGLTGKGSVGKPGQRSDYNERGERLRDGWRTMERGERAGRFERTSRWSDSSTGSGDRAGTHWSKTDASRRDTRDTLTRRGKGDRYGVAGEQKSSRKKDSEWLDVDVDSEQTWGVLDREADKKLMEQMGLKMLEGAGGGDNEEDDEGDDEETFGSETTKLPPLDGTGRADPSDFTAEGPYNKEASQHLLSMLKPKPSLADEEDEGEGHEMEEEDNEEQEPRKMRQQHRDTDEDLQYEEEKLERHRGREDAYQSKEDEDYPPKEDVSKEDDDYDKQNGAYEGDHEDKPMEGQRVGKASSGGMEPDEETRMSLSHMSLEDRQAQAQVNPDAIAFLQKLAHGGAAAGPDREPYQRSRTPQTPQLDEQEMENERRGPPETGETWGGFPGPWSAPTRKSSIEGDNWGAYKEDPWAGSSPGKKMATGLDEPKNHAAATSAAMEQQGQNWGGEPAWNEGGGKAGWVGGSPSLGGLGGGVLPAMPGVSTAAWAPLPPGMRDHRAREEPPPGFPGGEPEPSKMQRYSQHQYQHRPPDPYAKAQRQMRHKPENLYHPQTKGELEPEPGLGRRVDLQTLFGSMRGGASLPPMPTVPVSHSPDQLSPRHGGVDLRYDRRMERRDYPDKPSPRKPTSMHETDEEHMQRLVNKLRARRESDRDQRGNPSMMGRPGNIYYPAGTSGAPSASRATYPAVPPNFYHGGHQQGGGGGGGIPHRVPQPNRRRTNQQPPQQQPYHEQHARQMLLQQAQQQLPPQNQPQPNPSVIPHRVPHRAPQPPQYSGHSSQQQLPPQYNSNHYLHQQQAAAATSRHQHHQPPHHQMPRHRAQQPAADPAYLYRNY
eukprot:g41490.t1